MTMIRAKNKATKIAEKILKKEGAKASVSKKDEKIKEKTPYMQH